MEPDKLKEASTVGSMKRAHDTPCDGMSNQSIHLYTLTKIMEIRVKEPNLNTPITPHSDMLMRLPTPTHGGEEENNGQKFARRKQGSFLFSRSIRQPPWYQEIFDQETTGHTKANRGYYKFHGRPKEQKDKILQIINSNEQKMAEKLQVSGITRGPPNRKGNNVKWSDEVNALRAVPNINIPRLPSPPLPGEENRHQRYERRKNDSFLFRSSRQPPWYTEIFDKRTIDNTQANSGYYKIRRQSKENKERILEILNRNELSKERRLRELHPRGTRSANKQGHNVQWGSVTNFGDNQHKRRKLG